jgi:hypothetical protein
MKWLTEYFGARIMIVSLFKLRWRLSADQRELARRDQYRIEVGVMHICWPGKNRFTAQRYDRGDNLSVRFHIQNSISLTIAMLPRIICA